MRGQKGLEHSCQLQAPQSYVRGGIQRWILHPYRFGSPHASNEATSPYLEAPNAHHGRISINSYLMAAI